MILADTSIWIDHFRIGSAEMIRQLENRRIATHPFVIAELALGSLRDRATTLATLDHLPQLHVARITEVRTMIEERSLYSTGIGLTDAHLIASIFLNPPARLWTRDKRLRAVAEALAIHIDLA